MIMNLDLIIFILFDKLIQVSYMKSFYLKKYVNINYFPDETMFPCRNENELYAWFPTSICSILHLDRLKIKGIRCTSIFYQYCPTSPDTRRANSMDQSS